MSEEGQGQAEAPVDNWLLTMPEDLQNEPSLQSFSGPGGVEKLARGFVDTKRMVGDRIPIPQEGDTAKWNEVYTRLGRPETAEGYRFVEVQMPDGFALKQGLVDEYKGFAHSIGLTNKQASDQHKWYIEHLVRDHNQLLADYDSQVKAASEALRGSWGTDYDRRLDLAMRTFDTYATPEIKARVESSGAGNDPAFIELFWRIGKEMSEDVLRGGSSIYKGKEDRIKEILRDPAYLDDSSMEARQKRKVLVEEMERLSKEVYGETAL